jgi:hypothetical protein
MNEPLTQEEKLQRLEKLVAALLQQTEARAPGQDVSVPRPAPPPPPPVTPPRNGVWSRVYADMKMFTFGALVTAVLVFVVVRETAPRPTPGPGPVTPTPVPEVPVESDFRRLGKAYRGPLIENRAASWEVIATQLAAGVKPDDAIKSGDEDFRVRRERDFTGASAALEKIAPKRAEGHGAELAAAFRDMAAGIRTVP